MNLEPIPDYKGRSFSGYRACLETGGIWSLKRCIWLTATPIQYGFMRICLMDDDRKLYQTYAHRAVMAAKLQRWEFNKCRHLDGLRWNNRAENLILLDEIELQTEE